MADVYHPRVAFLCMCILTAMPVAGYSADPSDASPLAFPGAQGHGRYSEGGRSGRIVYVDNLKDHGPGSLRACVEDKGPRNCVFRVSGVIKLAASLLIEKENGHLSVLGQTAPGSGITLTIETPNKAKLHSPFIARNTTDVVVRHIRSRPRLPNTIANIDAFTIEDSERVYIDHVSGSWATDENVNTHADSTDVTIAHSIFGEGQNKHSKCALLGSDPHRPQNITFWKNACISNRDRNPDDNHYGGSCIEIVNNLFYNARSEWAEVFSQYAGGTPISIVANYFKAGPSTDNRSYAIKWDKTNSAAEPKIYAAGNEIWAPGEKKIALIAPDARKLLVDEPPCPLSIVPIVAAEEAYDDIRLTAGAFPRDDVDKRLIEEVGEVGHKGKGQMIKEPGLLPVMSGGTPYTDTDGDGMADSVEIEIGATVGLADAWDGADDDGQTNFDRFMEWLSQQRLAANAYPS
jgi:pectate lyase